MHFNEQEDWQMVDESLRGGDRLSSPELARASAVLSGGVKFARPFAKGQGSGRGGNRSTRLRAEWPMTTDDREDAELLWAAQRASMEHGVEQARAWVAGRDVAAAVGPRETGSGARVDATDCGELCREVGWHADVRVDGSAAVDLGVPGDYVAALVEDSASGLSASVTLAAAPLVGSAQEEAVALLLLRANAAFRLIRGVLRDDSVVLEVQLDSISALSRGAGSGCVTGWLSEALAALAVTARHTSREARLLCEVPSLAREFNGRAARRRKAPAVHPQLAVETTATT